MALSQMTEAILMLNCFYPQICESKNFLNKTNQKPIVRTDETMSWPGWLWEHYNKHNSVLVPGTGELSFRFDVLMTDLASISPLVVVGARGMNGGGGWGVGQDVDEVGIHHVIVK